jgi:hypothetical protein
MALPKQTQARNKRRLVLGSREDQRDAVGPSNTLNDSMDFNK